MEAKFFCFCLPQQNGVDEALIKSRAISFVAVSQLHPCLTTVFQGFILTPFLVLSKGFISHVAELTCTTTRLRASLRSFHRFFCRCLCRTS